MCQAARSLAGQCMSSAFRELEALRYGGKRLLAKALTRLETDQGSPELAAFLDEACQHSGGHVLGLTGPPGVGKSTLTDALIRAFRSRGERVCVLAIDPSSSVTGGALLGDRTRLTTDPDDDSTFVRSMAARDRLGGLSDHAVAAIAILRAVSDRVIVETVGIGQSEADLRQACDTAVLCIQPGSGDSLQFMKAGIMEMPDILCVTKSDMGAAARRAASDVAGALSIAQRNSDWVQPVCEISSLSGEGIDAFLDKVEDHRTYLIETGGLALRRAEQHAAWLKDMVRTEYGMVGLELLAAETGSADGSVEHAPFSTFRDFAARLDRLLGRAG